MGLNLLTKVNITMRFSRVIFLKKNRKSNNLHLTEKLWVTVTEKESFGTKLKNFQKTKEYFALRR